VQLVINTFGASLRKEGERFLVKAGEKQLAVSAHKVQSILITTGAHLSTDAIELANEKNIDLVFLNKYGEPFARVWQAKMGSTAAIRRQPVDQADTLASVCERGLGRVRHQHDYCFCATTSYSDFADR
jgi:CRISPR-associated protein Cas1